MQSVPGWALEINRDPNESSKLALKRRQPKKKKPLATCKCVFLCLFFQTADLLSSYLKLNKNKFFDLRNIRICFVENDPLGVAFGVKAFARTQVT
jgi:hypothetical protein